MGILSFFRKEMPKKNSASIAKDRLQIIVAHERNSISRMRPDFLPTLQKEILQLVQRYVMIEQDQVKINMDHRNGCDMLEVNIALSPNNEQDE